MVESSKKTETEVIESHGILPKDRTKNNAFINYGKDWDNEEHFKIPKDILKGIYEGINFKNPSKIQAVAVPLIQKQDKDGKYEHLIAQSKNGSGKTGAYAIGSLLRVDPSIKKVQVIVIGHTRELIIQITSVYEALTSFAKEYEVCNLVDHTGPVSAQIVVTTLGKLLQGLGARGTQGLDLSELRCIVIDEADFFLSDPKNKADLLKLHSSLETKKLNYQYILFSATYPEDVKDAIQQIIDTANQIRLKVEQLELSNIEQYEYQCDPRGKIDFLMKIFKDMTMTQTIIFVNTKSFAETVHTILRKNNYKSYIMFSEMSKEERDETMQKFRDNQINVLITTNLLARGFDHLEVDFVVNFDVPKMKMGGKWVPDDETYLHRIGRAGRFNQKGLAVTLYDNDDDKTTFHEILDLLKIKDKIHQLKGPEQVGEILSSITRAEGV